MFITPPRAIAVDASGKLYVPNAPEQRGHFSPVDVSVFDTKNANAALPSIGGGGFTGGGGLAVDTRGRLYVAAFTDDNSVSVFDTAHGNAALTPLSGDGLNTPGFLAIDAAGKLYVVDGGGVLVFDTAHGNAALSPITGGELNGPSGAAVQ